MDTKAAFLEPGKSNVTLMREGNTTLAAINKQLSKVGVAITQEDALMLNEHRVESLAETERVEFGAPALTIIVEAIATSPFLTQDSIADTLAELQSTFYALRDELPIDVPDAEIIEALHGCFEAYEGDATEVATLSKEAIMAFSEEYLHSTKAEEHGGHHIVDEDGRPSIMSQRPMVRTVMLDSSCKSMGSVPKNRLTPTNFVFAWMTEARKPLQRSKYPFSAPAA